jgi:hypothetical protein
MKHFSHYHLVYYKSYTLVKMAMIKILIFDILSNSYYFYKYRAKCDEL